MARLEAIRFKAHRSAIVDNKVEWAPVMLAPVINALPQIFWRCGSPWREANLWAHARATSRCVSPRTVLAEAASLVAYAKWLEETGTDWADFPPRKADRCLIRYRSALIEARDTGKLAPSTASQRMRCLVSFYRWLISTGLLSPAWPMWRERTVGIHLINPAGLERTIAVRTTDVSIPNRGTSTERLEDGLLPLSVTDRDSALDFARQHATEELFLMLSLGFFTGMRLGTICDLKVQTLTKAVPDPAAPGLFKIAVGPRASPQVPTKFGVTGHIWITRELLNRLVEYSHSVRRLTREAKASQQDRDVVFLTRFGNRYAQRDSNKSVAVNVEIHSFKKLAAANGLAFMRDFRFHQSRCTFATELARIAIKAGGAINAVAFVKEALLHKQETTTLKYIRFIEKTPIKEQMANAFTTAFLGLLTAQCGSANG